MKYIFLLLFFFSAKIVFCQNTFFTRLPTNSSPSFLSSPVEISGAYFAVSYYGDTPVVSTIFSPTGVFYKKSILLASVHLPYPEFVSGFKINGSRFLGGSTYHCSYLEYGLPNFQNPIMIKQDTNGLKNIFQFFYNKPTRFNFYDYSSNSFIYTTGETNRDTLNNQYRDSECTVMKIDTQGNEVWRYTINTSSYANIPGGIVATSDSGCLVVYYYGPWPAYSQCRATKLNKNGQFEWVKNIDLQTNGLWTVTVVDYEESDQSLCLKYFPYRGAGLRYPIRFCKLDKNMNKVWEVRNAAYDSIKVQDPNSLNPQDSVWNYAGTKYGWANITRAQGGKGWLGTGMYQSKLGYIVRIDENGKNVWEGIYDGIPQGNKKVYASTTGYSFGQANTTSDGGYIIAGGCEDTLGNQVGFLMKIDSMGCLTADSCETRFISSIRYYAPDALDWSIYPNPAQDKLFIKLANANDFSYTLSDIQGRKLTEGKLENEQPIAIGTLAKGIYLLSLTDKKGNLYSRKIVKE